MALKPPLCPVCNQPAILVDDSIIYKRSYGGKIWKCVNGHDCYVGAHPDGSPKGTMAGRDLRNARMLAHKAFDGWWKRRNLKRRWAYKYLSLVMQLESAHIGEFDMAQCLKVVDIFFGDPEPKF